MGSGAVSRAVGGKSQRLSASRRPILRYLFLLSGCITLLLVGLAVGLAATSGASTATSPVTSTTTATLVGPQIEAPDGSGPNQGAFTSVICTTSSSCIAVGVNGSSGIAAISADGGDTWAYQALPSGTPGLAAVSCANTTDCVAVGAGVELSTNNGGSNWSTHTPPTEGTTFYGVFCQESLTCVAVGVLPNSVGPYSGEIAVSDDGGSTWSAAPVPSGTPGLAGVTCPTSTTCIAVGATILTSDDSGATWQQRTVNGGTQPLTSISCQSTTVCIAVAPNPDGLDDPSAADAAITSIDGGNTWNPATFPNGTAGIGQISCSPSGACEAIGSPLLGGAPVAVSSSASGTGWTLVQAPTQLSSVAGISCGSDGCVVVGESAGAPASAVSGSSSSWTSEDAQ